MSAASRPFRIFGVLVSSASVRAMSALAGVCWAFAHGAGGIGRSMVVIGGGGVGVCANAGANGGGGGANGDVVSSESCARGT